MHRRFIFAALEAGFLLAFGASAWAGGRCIGCGTPVQVPDAHHICESGQVLLVYPDGAKSCDLPAPRSQADCPAETKFVILSGRGGCVEGNVDRSKRPLWPTDVWSGVVPFDH